MSRTSLVLLLLATLPGSARADSGSFKECYGEHFQQCFDFYATGSPDPAPLVVLVHPGAWWTGDKAQGRPPISAARFQARGYAAASINYRYTIQPGEPHPVTSLPAQVDDVIAAVEYIRSNASQPRFNVDPDRIVLWGMSGGGYLVSAATLLRGLQVRGVVDLFGPTTFGRRQWGGLLAWDQDLVDAGHLPYRGCNPGLVPPGENPPCDPEHHPGWFDNSGAPLSSLSALLGCSADDPSCSVDDASLDDPGRFVKEPPPFLIIHHNSDDVVAKRQSERLAAALGSSASLQTFKGGHYYIELTDDPAVDQFLDEHVN